MSRSETNSITASREEILMLKSVMKQRPVASFFVLAYLISWVFWVPTVLYIQLALPAGEVPGWLMIPNLLGTWGPFFAALIMTGILEGKAGIRKLFAQVLVWRVGILWYLIAFLLPIVLLFAALGIYTLQGGVAGRFAPGQWYMLFLAPLPALLFGPLGEELGWRGYALPRLQRKTSALWSSVIVGVLWALWHAPAYWAPAGTAISGQPVTLLAVGWYVLFIVGISILHTWIYNHTKASVLIAILFHAMYTSGAVYPLFPDISTNALNQSVKWAIVPVWIAALLIIALFGRARLSRKPISLGPGEERA
jgi:membrane protease YdiL (CAAX protease family)